MAHILVVDDEPDILSICKTYFEYEGHQVTTAFNGVDGLAKIDDTIDLLVLDIMMPELDGIELVQRLHQQGIDKPFIYLTAKTQEQDLLFGLTLGADDYIMKPFNPRELVLRVNNLLRRTTPQTQVDKHLTFGTLALDARQHRALVGDEDLQLRTKEFDVLWYLAEREDAVVSKSELLEKVWGFDYYEDASTVNVHVHRIREKLEKYDLAYQISTVWGLGYRFERVTG